MSDNTRPEIDGESIPQLAGFNESTDVAFPEGVTKDHPRDDHRAGDYKRPPHADPAMYKQHKERQNQIEMLFDTKRLCLRKGTTNTGIKLKIDGEGREAPDRLHGRSIPKHGENRIKAKNNEKSREDAESAAEIEGLQAHAARPRNLLEKLGSDEKSAKDEENVDS